jgi:hypothetical protein
MSRTPGGAEKCPFRVGDIVYYRPSIRGQGLSANDPPNQTPRVGEAVRIMCIANGLYVEVEGYQHPGGGVYWTEFSST